MNLVLLEAHEVDGRTPLVLRGRRARHVLQVLRARPGDGLRIGVIRGPRGTGEVLAVDPVRVEVTVRPEWHQTTEIVPEINLILALPRPKVLARVLQTVACMGVRAVHVVNAWRVDKSFWHSPQLDPESLRENLLLGCEQGARTWLPDIQLHRLLMPFVRGPLETILAGHRGSRLIAHPHARQRIEGAVAAPVTPALVAIGPERGWIDRELATFVECGFSAVSLGDAVLRVDTAVSALFAQLALLERLQA